MCCFGQRFQIGRNQRPFLVRRIGWVRLAGIGHFPNPEAASNQVHSSPVRPQAHASDRPVSSDIPLPKAEDEVREPLALNDHVLAKPLRRKVLIAGDNGFDDGRMFAQ